MNVLETLRKAFAAATPEGGDPKAFALAVRSSTDPKFGDYQANGCMAIAKASKKNPRELALEVARVVDLTPMAGTLPAGESVAVFRRSAPGGRRNNAWKVSLKRRTLPNPAASATSTIGMRVS